MIFRKWPGGFGRYVVGIVGGNDALLSALVIG